jgi:TonB family protein
MGTAHTDAGAGPVSLVPPPDMRLAILIPTCLALTVLAAEGAAAQATRPTPDVARLSLDGIRLNDTLPSRYRTICEAQRRLLNVANCKAEVPVAGITTTAQILLLDARVNGVAFTFPSEHVERIRDLFSEQLGAAPISGQSPTTTVDASASRRTNYLWRMNDFNVVIVPGTANVARATISSSSNTMALMSRNQRITDSLQAAPRNADQPYMEFQVNTPVKQAPGTVSPAYPEQLKAAGLGGEVIAQFVVDTLGRAELNTFKVLKASHTLFAAAVRAALPSMRFTPAELNGRKVKQLVQQPFVFGVSPE